MMIFHMHILYPSKRFGYAFEVDIVYECYLSIKLLFSQMIQTLSKSS